VTLIKLCAFVGSNCNNGIVMHRMGNVKFQHTLTSTLTLILQRWR